MRRSFAVWVVFAGVNLLWVSLDGQPQGCDQANHLMHSMELSSGLAAMDGARLWEWWTAGHGPYTYPPLYHLLTGFAMLVIPRPAVAAVLVNLLFLWLLVRSVVQIGTRAFDEWSGLTAAVLTAMLPQLAQLAHEAFVDFALTGMVAWCVWRLLAAGDFGDRRAALALGCSLGAALLLKQMAALYLIGPVLASLWLHRHNLHRRNLINGLLCLASAAMLAAPWYAFHLLESLQVGSFNQQIAVVEGDPMPWTLAGALFYPHSMASLQVGFAVFAVGVAVMIAFAITSVVRPERDLARRAAQAVVASWLVVGLALLGFAILNKDVRYSMPVLPAFALLTAGPSARLPWRRLRMVARSLLIGLALPYCTHILFAWPPFPTTVAFRSGSLWWMAWNEDYYYGSAPLRDDWGIGETLQHIQAEREVFGAGCVPRIGIVPFLLRLNGNSIQLEAMTRGMPVAIYEMGSDESFDQPGGILHCDYLLTKTGDLGLSFETGQAERIAAFVAGNPDRFLLVRRHRLPDGSESMLYAMDQH